MSGKTTIIQNLKNPTVLIIGGVIGLVLVLKAKNSGGSVYDAGYTQAMVTTHQSDNELAAKQMAIQANTEQARVDADNTRFLVSAGLNADITKTALQAQTAVTLASEQTKQLIGLGNIQANRDVTINLQNTERDKYVVHDTNQTSIVNTQTKANAQIQHDAFTVQNNQIALQKNAQDIAHSEYMRGIQSNEWQIQQQIKNAWAVELNANGNQAGAVGLMYGSGAANSVLAGEQSGANQASNIMGSVGKLASSITPLISLFV